MSFQRIVIETPQTAASFKSVCDLSMGGQDALNNLAAYLVGVNGGQQAAKLTVQVGDVKAAGTLTFASTGPTNSQTCTICNVTFTAVTNSATGNQFNISSTPATVAANLVAAVNASAVSSQVVASNLLGVVTFTAVVPGTTGNGLQLSAGNLSNVTLSAMAGGVTGTEYVLNFL